MNKFQHIWRGVPNGKGAGEDPCMEVLMARSGPMWVVITWENPSCEHVNREKD